MRVRNQLLLLAVAFFVSSCASGGGYSGDGGYGGDSGPTRYYCGMEGYENKSGHKAIAVAALDGGGCFSTWDQPSEGTAVKRALEDCRKETPSDPAACMILFVGNHYNDSSVLSHNCQGSLSEFSGRENHRALALGDEHAPEGSCHSVWGRGSAEEAIQDAMEECRREIPGNPAACTVVAYDSVVSRIPAYGNSGEGGGGGSGGGGDLGTLPGWLRDARSGCAVWDLDPEPGWSVTWSGGCEDGKASGRGTLVWHEKGEAVIRYEGEMKDGKEHGRRIFTTSEGDRYEGDLRDGKEHGRGIYLGRRRPL